MRLDLRDLWRRHRWLVLILAVGGLLRLLPLLLWPGQGCTRDECTYQSIARGIVAGHGMTAPEEWLWAPGYPYLLALSLATTGSEEAVKWLQVWASLASMVALWRIGSRVGDDRVGWLAAAMYAVVFSK